MNEQKGHFTAADLLSSRDPIVGCYIQMWKTGSFPTFEQMLLALVGALIESNNLKHKSMVEYLERNTPYIKVGE